MDITSIRGKTVLNKSGVLKLLEMLVPARLRSTDTQYHIGYEAAKADMRAIVLQQLSPDQRHDPFMRLIQDLRNGS